MTAALTTRASAAGAEQPASTAPPRWLLPAIAHFPRLGAEPLRRAATEGLASHERVWGPNPVMGEGLQGMVRAAGLRGRGGAWFEAARKWDTVLSAGPDPVVVANGAEGEALSAKDAALLQCRPHLILDGIELAAGAIGSRQAFVWLHEGALSTHQAVSDALRERPPSPVRILVRTGPDHYLTGESSAAVRALSGGPALPAFRRVPAAVAGVDGRPTLLHNVETLARLAALARGGDGRLPAGGIDSSMVTLVTPNDRTVTEVRRNATFRELVLAHYGSADVRAVLLGGYGGEWVGFERIGEYHVDESALRRQGLSLGAGIVAAIPTGACGIAETARIVRHLAGSSARQCGPCLFGLAAVADNVEALARGAAGRTERKRLTRYVDEIYGRGGCHHPDGAVRLVRSMLDVFADDVERHVRKGRCGGSLGHVPVPGQA